MQLQKQQARSRNMISKKKKKPKGPYIAKGLRGKKGEGLRMSGTDKKFQRSYPGEDPKIEEHADPVEDIETTLPEPNDAGSKHKYPPPKKHPRFRKVWMDFIDNITGRKNFKTGHLNALEILCDLHVEYDDLRAFVRKHGRTYKSYGRQGLAHKFYPEVTQLNNVQTQINNYMKTLGLILNKDDNPGDPNGGEKNEWS